MENYSIRRRFFSRLFPVHIDVGGGGGGGVSGRLVNVLHDGFFQFVGICAGKCVNLFAIFQENECRHA